MKFKDKMGYNHDTHISAISANIGGTLGGFVGSSIHGVVNGVTKLYNKVKGIDNVDDPTIGLYEFEDVCEIESDDPSYKEDDMSIISPDDRDNIFIPAVTPKIPRSKKHSIMINYKDHKISLMDENDNVINTTNIDPRIEDCSLKNIIDMVYETTEDSEDDE